MTGAEEECGACAKARSYYSSCLDPGGRLEKLGGRPLVQLLHSFYWNITDFDGGTQMEHWQLQVSLHLHYTALHTPPTVYSNTLMVADSAGGGAARLQCGRAVRVERGRGRQELQQTRAPGHSRGGHVYTELTLSCCRWTRAG